MRCFLFIIIYSLFTSSKLKASSYQISQYETITALGKGAYGTVIKARSSPHLEIKEFAIKIIEIEKRIDKTPKEIDAAQEEWEYENSQVENEVDLLKKCNHYNIVKLLYYESEYTSTNAVHNLYFELADTDLSKIILSYKEKSEPLSIKHRAYITYQILLALIHLKSYNVIHKDLKPANILIDANVRVRIADFGLAEEIDKGSPPKATHLVQTRWYRAPEVLKKESFDFSIDIWSLGCIVSEMLTFSPLFPGRKRQQLEQIKLVLSNPIDEHLKKEPYYHKDCSTDEINIITFMLELNPNYRITCESALESPYFKDNESQEYYEDNQASSDEPSEPRTKKQKY